MRRRTQTARWLLAGPVEWGLAFRVVVFAATVSSLKRVVALPKLARFMRRRDRLKPGSPERDQRALALVRWLYGTGDGRCLDRALVLSRLLAETHADVQLVVSMRNVSGRWGGHAWVLLDGQPFGEDASALEGFEPLLVFSARGSIHPDSSATWR